MPDPDTHAHVFVIEMRGDRAQAVVAGVAATDFDLELARQQVDLVVKHHHIARGELEKSRRLTNGAAALVHVGVGLEQQDFGAIEIAVAGEALEPLAPWPEAVPLGDPVKSHEADVVPIVGVFRPGISQPHEQLHRALVPSVIAAGQCRALQPRPVGLYRSTPRDREADIAFETADHRVSQRWGHRRNIRRWHE